MLCLGNLFIIFGSCIECVNGMKFIIRDCDNDNDFEVNCVIFSGGGWWYNVC